MPRHGPEALRNVLKRPRTMGNCPQVDGLASSLQRSGMTRMEQQFNPHGSASRRDGRTAPNRLRDDAVCFDPVLMDGPSPKWIPEMGAGRHRQPSSPIAGLKPIGDGIRKVLPFGSPRGEGQHEQTRRFDGGDARSQVDPPQGGTGARVQRHRRWRGSVAAPASGVYGRPGVAGFRPTAGPVSRGPLNGLAGALSGVLRRRIIGGGRRCPDMPPTGLYYARLGGEPAYPPWPRFARPWRELAGGCAPSDPHIAHGAS